MSKQVLKAVEEAEDVLKLRIEAFAVLRPSRVSLIVETRTGMKAYHLTEEQTEALRKRLG
jgi:hypothetical protein